MRGQDAHRQGRIFLLFMGMATARDGRRAGQMSRGSSLLCCCCALFVRRQHPDATSCSSHPGKSILSGELITSDKFQISGIPENMDISWSKTMILAETLNFSMRKFQVSARIVVSDKLIHLFSGISEI
jgi:hypothetical protein